MEDLDEGIATVTAATAVDDNPPAPTRKAVKKSIRKPAAGKKVAKKVAKTTTPKKAAKKVSGKTTTAKATKTAKSAIKGAAKKTATKKATTKKAAATKKATPKKVATKKAAKTTTKAAAKKVPTPRSTERNAHGYIAGTDGAIISDLLVAGGESRDQITHDLPKHMNATSRNGLPKNLSSLVSGVIKTLTQNGYTIEQTYRLVPPSGKAKTGKSVKSAATRARGNKASKSIKRK